MPRFVSNSSPLIAFERLELSGILESLTGGLCIPTAVREEVFGDAPVPDWVQIHPISDHTAPRILAPRLGPGEREAITLALELEPHYLLLDDLPARRIAQELGIPILGTLGLLLLAKERGLIPALRPCLDQLIDLEFRLSSRLYRAMLERAGEG